MLRKPSDHVGNCLDQAADARRRAAETLDARTREDLLRLAQSWDCLAQSFEFAEAIERFLLRHGHETLGGWELIDSAPFDRDLELAVIDGDLPHALVFACRRVLGGWIEAATRRRIDAAPTHWREWRQP